MKTILFWLFLSPAFAHEWYPPDCCSGGDCIPIANERVHAMISGYVIDGRHIVPYSQVRTSLDGRFHACFPRPDKLQCLFVPPPAM
jgi:hypothetical protein